ncbi:hypothetical protein HaLaN_24749, partial [Haematococcus lacustris]
GLQVPLLVQLLKEQVLQAQRSALGWDAGLAVNLVTVMTAAAQGGQAGAQAVLEAPVPSTQTGPVTATHS